MKAKLTLAIQPDDVGAEVQLIRAIGLAARKDATPEDRKDAAACVQRAKLGAPASELARVGALITRRRARWRPPGRRAAPARLRAPPPKKGKEARPVGAAAGTGTAAAPAHPNS
jgi:hypothetical protein